MSDGGEAGGLLDTENAFSDATIRRGFIKKVYGILSLQLVVTMGIMGIFFLDSVKLYASHNVWMFWLAFAVTFACLIALSCCPNVRRKSPSNFICLGIFTLAEGFLMGCVVATYSADEVLLAVGITVILVLGLTVFAVQTKWDFTAMGGFLLVAVLCLLMFGFFASFMRSPIVNIVYASLGAFIFACYIIVDTQMMMGGKHKYALDPEEYIFASLNLYLDIINLFLFILSIIGNSRN